MYVRVKAIPRAKQESIKKEKGKDRFLVSVREKAEENRANERIREILAHEFHISVGKVRLISGHHSPTKMFSLDLDA